MKIDNDQVRRLAALELNAATYSGALNADEWDGATLPRRGTPIYDINGTVLFHRFAVKNGRAGAGFVDVAGHEALGAPLLAASWGAPWNQAELKKAAIAAVTKGKRRLKFTRTRFVAYSYPKLALQLLNGKEEVAMVELFTWKRVPAPPTGKKPRKPLEPENFERWSLLDEMPRSKQLSRSRNFQKRLEVWDKAEKRKANRKFLYDRVSLAAFKSFVIKNPFVDTWEVHYSKRSTDHHVCFELRGQETNVWCVGASTQMLLDFYRYEYTQTRLAVELGLGTAANPNGLPYSRVGDVVDVVEAMSSNALDCTMVVNPGWTTFRNELKQNRPLISFVPGHSRTVVGYTRTRLLLPSVLAFRGLLVFDPWPPNAGVITRWENFDTQTYQYAYTSAVTLA